MNILGIDPDTKTTGIGIVRDGRPVYGHLVEVAQRSAKMDVRRPNMVARMVGALRLLRLTCVDAERIDIIVVEGQFIYPPKGGDSGTERPNDIVNLAQQAGVAMAAAVEAYPTAQLLVPLPVDWKGSVRKSTFTVQLLKKLGLKSTDRGLEFVGSTARLPGTIQLKAKDATHVIDALGLARWAHMRTPR